MRVRQRLYLRLPSEEVEPGGITEMIGLEPSRTTVKQPLHPGQPRRPRYHHWALDSGVTDDAPLRDHIDALWQQLVAAADRLRAFTDRPGCFGYLEIVRYFEEGEEDFEEATWGLPPDSALERLEGQHPFLGFALDATQVQLLALMGIGIDVDEYG